MFFLIICIVTYLWDALQWLPLAFIPLCIPLPACARLICVTNRMWQIDGMLFAKVFYERYCGFPLGLSLFCITHLGRSQLSCSIALWWNPSDKYLSLPASDHRIELAHGIRSSSPCQSPLWLPSWLTMWLKPYWIPRFKVSCLNHYWIPDLKTYTR